LLTGFLQRPLWREAVAAIVAPSRYILTAQCFRSPSAASDTFLLSVHSMLTYTDDTCINLTRKR
jgi:hypothetical protein